MRTPQNVILEEGTITGVFRSRDDAESAYNALIEKGYAPDEIILLSTFVLYLVWGRRIER